MSPSASLPGWVGDTTAIVGLALSILGLGAALGAIFTRQVKRVVEPIVADLTRKVDENHQQKAAQLERIEGDVAEMKADLRHVHECVETKFANAAAKAEAAAKSVAEAIESGQIADRRRRRVEVQ